MFRIDNATNTTPIPTPAAVGPNVDGFYTLNTVVTPDWMNAVQEELAHVVEQPGGALSKTDRTQVYTAIAAMISTAIASLASPTYNMMYIEDVKLKAVQGGSCIAGSNTRNLNAVQVDNIAGALLMFELPYLSKAGGPFTVGETVTAPSGASAVIEDLNGGVTPLLMQSHSGNGFINGETFTGGLSGATADVDVTPTDTDRDTVTGMYGRGEFQLPAGTYFFEFDAPVNGTAIGNIHQVQLTTKAGAILLYGTSEAAGGPDAENNVTRSFGKGEVVLASATNLVINHLTSIAVATVGLGVPVATGSVVLSELYARVEIRKTA